MPLVTLLDFLEPPTQPERPRLRRAPSNQYLHVRRVKGRAFQARPWLGVHAGGSLNLGLFTIAQWETPADAEWAAGRASKAFRAFYRPHQPGHGLRETIEHLKARNLIPTHVRPPRVRDVEGGYVGFVRLSKRKLVVETPVFTCPWRAYESMCATLATLLPRKPNKLELRARARAEKRRTVAQGKRLVTLADTMG